MKKFATLSAAAAILAMAGTAVYAQSSETTPPQGQSQRMGKKIDWQARHAEMQRVAEARIAGIPAGLKLTADQQKLWQPVETALKATMTARGDFMAKMRDARKDAKERPDFMQRLEARSEMTQMAAQNSKAMLDAMKPFWASLDEGQQKLLPSLMRTHGFDGMPMHGQREHRGMMGKGWNGNKN